MYLPYKGLRLLANLSGLCVKIGQEPELDHAVYQRPGVDWGYAVDIPEPYELLTGGSHEWYSSIAAL